MSAATLELLAAAGQAKPQAERGHSACRRSPYAFGRHNESIVEAFHLVYVGCSGNLFSALAKEREEGSVAQGCVLHPNIVQGALFTANGEDRPCDVFEPAVLHPELVVVLRVDVDRCGKIAERISDEREARLMFANRGLTLAFEGGVDQRQLPGR